MSAVRLHPFHFLKYIKYGLILCVIPILRAMLAFDIAAAWLAFTQDLLILLACGGILATLWQASCAGLADAAPPSTAPVWSAPWRSAGRSGTGFSGRRG